LEGVIGLMQGFEAVGKDCFEIPPDEAKVLNAMDEEPEAELIKCITVVPPGHLKEMTKVPAEPPADLDAQE
jgi:hypothetical protein